MEASKAIENFPPAPLSFNSFKENKKNRIRIKKFKLNKNIPNNSISINKKENELDDALSKAIDMKQKGYLPLFLKINDYRPLYFFIKEEAKLERLIKPYFENCPEANERLINGIKLYCNKRYLDINSPVKDLNLDPFSIIRNIKADSI